MIYGNKYFNCSLSIQILDNEITQLESFIITESLQSDIEKYLKISINKIKNILNKFIHIVRNSISKVFKFLLKKIIEINSKFIKKKLDKIFHKESYITETNERIVSISYINNNLFNRCIDIMMFSEMMNNIREINSNIPEIEKDDIINSMDKILSTDIDIILEDVIESEYIAITEYTVSDMINFVNKKNNITEKSIKICAEKINELELAIRFLEGKTNENDNKLKEKSKYLDTTFRKLEVFIKDNKHSIELFRKYISFFENISIKFGEIIKNNSMSFANLY